MGHNWLLLLKIFLLKFIWLGFPDTDFETDLDRSVMQLVCGPLHFLDSDLVVNTLFFSDCLHDYELQRLNVVLEGVALPLELPQVNLAKLPEMVG